MALGDCLKEEEFFHDASQAPHMDGVGQSKRPDRFSPGAVEQPKKRHLVVCTYSECLYVHKYICIC